LSTHLTKEVYSSLIKYSGTKEDKLKGRAAKYSTKINQAKERRGAKA